MNPVHRALQKALRIQTAHPVAIVLIALALTALSAIYTARNLKFQTSQMALISPQNRLVKLSEKIDSFDDLDNFVVVIESTDPARSREFLHALAPRLKDDHENYLQVFYRVDPETLKNWQLLYMDKKDLSTLRDNLKEHREFIQNLVRSPSLTRFFTEVNREMTTSMVGELFTGFLDEDTTAGKKSPLDLGFLSRILEEMRDWLDGRRDFTSPWESFFTGKPSRDQSREGYFWTENKRYLLCFVTPRKVDNSFANAQRSLVALRKTISQLKTEFPDVKAGVTGQEALNEDEMGVALRDMGLATLISLAGLTLLLVLFWKGARRPLLEITELVFALSWTFGLTTLFIGHLNILSITFAPLLLGLGIDYGIHWFARYQEVERARGSSNREAIETTTMKLGPGIILAGLTASLSFFPLVLTGFKGLEELGLITSMGMLMTTVTTLGVLPPLTLIFERRKKRMTSWAPASPSPYLFKITRGRALAVLIPGTVALGLSLWGVRGVAFDLNMLHLQSKGAESVVWEKKLLDGSERSSMYAAVLSHSLEGVRKKAAVLKALPSVSEVESVESLLPEDQEGKISLLEAMKPLLPEIGPPPYPVDPVNVSELDTILGRIRFKMLDSSASGWGEAKPIEAQMVRVRDLIGQIRIQFQTIPSTQLTGDLKGFENTLLRDLDNKLETLKTDAHVRPMAIGDLPESLLQRFVGENHLYLIRVFPAQDIWEPDLLGRFVRDLRSVEPDVIGDPVTLYVFTKAFRDASVMAAIYAVVFIFVLLLATFRSVVDTFLVLIPLFVGTAWTLGLMRLLGVDLNLANSIFLPLVVGAGVEYGIILMQRMRQQWEIYRGEVLIPFSTAKGVILAGLTTTVGFGSLTISAHQGIRSLGLLAMIGSLSILAAAILFLPAFLQVLTNRAESRRTHLARFSVKENMES